MKKKLIGFSYYLVLSLCAIFLFISFHLALDCIIAYCKSSVCTNACGEFIREHNTTYLTIISSCIVGFVASLIQLILLIRNKKLDKQKVINNTLNEINNVKSCISKFEFTLLEIRNINEGLLIKMNFISGTGCFNLSIDEYSYLQTLETNFLNSNYRNEILGDDNVRTLLTGNLNNQQYVTHLDQLVFINVQKRLDFVAGKLNELLGKYYTGLLDESVFDENKDGIVDYYVRIIMYYVASCYNLNDYNDYVYLVDYIIDNFC